MLTKYGRCCMEQRGLWQSTEGSCRGRVIREDFSERVVLTVRPKGWEEASQVGGGGGFRVPAEGSLERSDWGKQWWEIRRELQAGHYFVGMPGWAFECTPKGDGKNLQGSKLASDMTQFVAFHVYSPLYGGGNRLRHGQWFSQNNKAHSWLYQPRAQASWCPAQSSFIWLCSLSCQIVSATGTVTMSFWFVSISPAPSPGSGTRKAPTECLLSELMTLKGGLEIDLTPIEQLLCTGHHDHYNGIRSDERSSFFKGFLVLSSATS